MGMGSTLGQLCCLLVVLSSSSLTTAKEWSLKDVRVTLLDAGGNKVQTNSGSYPAELLNSPQIPEQHVIQVAASVLADNEPFKPQQMFLALKHVETGVAAYMVGKAKKGSTYELTANAALIEKQIGKLAGLYEVSLMVGHPEVSQGLVWKLGQVELVLPTSDPSPSVRTAHTQPISNVRPIITHMFRPPEKRPPAMISMFFAALVVLILAALIGFLVLGLGVNFNGWPQDGMTALSALAFHGLIAAMLGLYLVFWLRWNLIQTLPVALGLGAALVAVGHKALSGIATERLNSKTGVGSKVSQKMD
uniref:Ribophorin II n=1 Tax=Dunaliella tertiolecta TaxID=3047 RepID=A0A7S3QP46_DUNTE|mmetsp:Transcript_27263/g.73679  ORF Transcript_27263/g.73679 Transcript_27263/m.73679 type:complete len:305 (-) Transcript_27263:213-1127(-)|eukprot:CAMPEP_0202341840 /NCGR_PEP_ID=MMETSP1126-20121109/2661_1 /ASSEMBLY_ACC=CAM_ASM_000457 /TAXON_ID=3047 /ORGANISM="Dunaliella tertiolecta, Strain CCMP1320" /LENGTH=304 /DNA_ID=CAMNT_0048932711 /DNA_START=65 /DNA_END=979 /DNA_ORIENTATION=+